MFTYRQNSRVVYEIGVGEHDGDVRFLTGSRNKAVLRMRNEKYAIWPLVMAESFKVFADLDFLYDAGILAIRP